MQIRNEVYRERKSLQRRYFELKIQALEKDHTNSIKYIVSINISCQYKPQYSTGIR